MNKKSIITTLLALVAMTGQAKKTIVWENPSVAYSAIPYFEIQKVEMTKEKTARDSKLFSFLFLKRA